MEKQTPRKQINPFYSEQLFGNGLVEDVQKLLFPESSLVQAPLRSVEGREPRSHLGYTRLIVEGLERRYL
jgi:hypothetical protein